MLLFELPKIPFSTNVRPNAEINIEACLLYQFDKFNQIIPPLKIKLKTEGKSQFIFFLILIAWRIFKHYFSRRGFMPIPEDISLYNIQASIFSLLNKTRPHLQKWQPSEKFSQPHSVKVNINYSKKKTTICQKPFSNHKTLKEQNLQ